MNKPANQQTSWVDSFPHRSRSLSGHGASVILGAVGNSSLSYGSGSGDYIYIYTICMYLCTIHYHTKYILSIYTIYTIIYTIIYIYIKGKTGKTNCTPPNFHMWASVAAPSNSVHSLVDKNRHDMGKETDLEGRGPSLFNKICEICDVITVCWSPWLRWSSFNQPKRVHWAY